MDKEALKPEDRFKAPYAEAGHDVESVFAAPAYKCKVCGAYQIDLSEDLVYGDIRPCRALSQGEESNG